MFEDRDLSWKIHEIKSCVDEVKERLQELEKFVANLHQGFFVYLYGYVNDVIVFKKPFKNIECAVSFVVSQTKVNNPYVPYYISDGHMNTKINVRDLKLYKKSPICNCEQIEFSYHDNLELIEESLLEEENNER